MQLNIYWTTLLILLPAVILLTGRKTIIIRPFLHIHTKWQKVEVDEEAKTPSGSDKEAVEEEQWRKNDADKDDHNNEEEASRLRHTFLGVYLLVMSSEWLSGPYLYTLLRDDRALPESVIVALYATAYTSAAVSATVTGFLADRYGRRRAGVAQCGVHSLACLSVIFGGDCLPVLFVGRVLAGTALTLLWTVFESWMVTEWNARGLGERNGDKDWVEGGGGLGKMFGLMTTANCMAAMGGGILGHCMVSVMGSKTWPFWAGIAFEIVAVTMMMRNWNENYGVAQQSKAENEESVVADSNGSKWFGDGRIWALTFVTCCFEGTTFLIMFIWPSVLQNTHVAGLARTDPDIADDEVPYGVIFATFMAAMILGVLIFSASSRRGVPPVWLLMIGVMVANWSLFFLAILDREMALFCSFLLFEVANGMYVPSMAYLRGLVVDEKSRTGMYGLMKIPLFVFVILALGITAEGSRFKRLIFASASVCLLLAAIALVVGFATTAERCPKEPTKSMQGDLGVHADAENGSRIRAHKFDASDGSQ